MSGTQAAAISVENPATGETLATVPGHGPEGVAQMVASARAAQPAWEALGYLGRAEIRLVVRYAPLGVVGVIGPWNYPLRLSG